MAEHRPDFLTMDINIKGDRDGVTAACESLAKFGTRSIVVSALGDAATKARAAPANAIGWVHKPIVNADLADAISLLPRCAVQDQRKLAGEQIDGMKGGCQDGSGLWRASGGI